MKNGLRILLVDDNRDDRALAARSLKKALADCSCMEVGTEAEFTQALTENGFDVVITDYQLRWSDGLTVLRDVLAQYPFVPVIMFTNTGSEEICSEAMKNGLSDYVIKKPKHYVRLPHSVRHSLERVQLKTMLQEQLVREQRARKEAEIANRQKDEFLAAVSHELRTPLNAIMGWADIMYKEIPPDDKFRKPVEVIRRNVRTQVQLIDDLLDMSRIVSGNLRLDVQALQIDKLLTHTVNLFRPIVEARQIELRTVLDSTPGVIKGDPQRLQQIFVNLLDNAIKFTPAGGRITVYLERVNSHVEISIQDNGRGIAPELLPHVFDRFYQGEPIPGTSRKGLGLGLSLVKELVALQGGTVRAKSGGPVEGTTFVVTFPVAVVDAKQFEPPDSQGADRNTCEKSLDGLDVIAVDDDDDAIELMRVILEHAGASVRLASSTPEALALIDEKRPDVVVTDLQMPGEDGYALLRRIRQREATSNTPVIALTAFARAKDRQRALASGFQYHLAKPMEPGELVTVVASVARWRQLNART
jgi:signal transduction histidine kinase